MIAGLTRSGPPTQRVPDWPEKPRPLRPRPLFEARPSLRKLAVVADADLLAASDDDAGLTRAGLLAGLLTLPYIKLLRYRDEGPAGDLSPEGDAPGGWACLLPPDSMGGWDLVYAYDSGEQAYAGVSRAAAAYARNDTGSVVYRDRPADAAADQRERDSLAASVAVAAEADLFVTERPYLYADRKVHVPGVTLYRIPEALAMVGLYLRSQGEFVLWRDENGLGLTANEWLFYQIGAVALLPEHWRWGAAARHEAYDALAGLSSALRLRIVRALRTWDSFHRALNLPQERDAVRTLLMELDTLLVTLMGAIDAPARVINLLLAIESKQHEVGWQKSGWHKKLTEKNRSLADLFARGTPQSDLLTILSRLRNTVHGQAIEAVTRQNGPVRDAPITLPAQSEEEILACMDRLRGCTAWGAKLSIGATAVIDPGRFVEQLFPEVLRLLNTVMAATPPAYVHGERPLPNSGTAGTASATNSASAGS